MKQVMSIPYAEGERSFEVDEANLLESQLPRIPDGLSREQEEKSLRGALDNPVGAERLSELAKSGQNVVLLVDDWTRPTPAYKVAPAVIQRLLEFGIRAGDIKIIFARGTHQALSREQMERKLGKDLIDRFVVENHDPDGNVTYLGESRSGTPVYINRSFMEADC